MVNKIYKPILIDSITAGEDLEKHRFVGFDGKHCQAGAKALGVCDVETESGQLAPVGVLGIFLVEAAGTITAGSAVTSDANGKAVAVSNNDAINGYSLDSATTGSLIRVVRGI